MNLILISSCNKKCSFCFAKPYVQNPERDIMSFDVATSVVTELFHTGERISLLGGEPTLYPDFIPLMAYIKDLVISNPTVKPDILLISNFLFEDEAVGEAIRDMSETKNLQFLLNVAEMSKSQMELFIHNVNTYIAPDQGISPGITLSKKVDASYYINILDTINKGLDNIRIEQVRLSPPNPMPGQIAFTEYVQDEQPIYRKQIRDILDWCIDNRLPIGFDCGITPCLFDEEVLPFEYVAKWTSRVMPTGCNSVALDLKPDGKLISCYPGTGIADSIHSYDDVITVSKSVLIKRRREGSTLQPPKECLCCSHYMRGCTGPCIGFYTTKEKE